MTPHPMADTRGGAVTRWPCVALALALALALPGCPGPTPDPDPEPPSPTFRLELGQGASFTPITEGAPLFVQQGYQGGQMTLVSLRAWELSPLSTTVELALTNVDTGKKVSQDYRVRLSFSPGGDPEAPAELTGLQLVLSGTPPVGQTVRLTATVQSASGEKVTDSRTGPLQWQPSP
ncbi:MAG: hypothetical protein ACJ8AT_05700 [Hyalangium sp.]|uniref:hypothetical protein n=1 Tax=Hyalangium sp. TaxID=2028555 RepID=UPI00389A44EC